MRYNEKAGLLPEPPRECDLKVGDLVTYTNGNGAVFHDMVVIGFSCGRLKYRQSAFIHLDFHKDAVHQGAAWWFPHVRADLVRQDALILA